MPDFGRWTSSGGDPSLNEINRTDRFLDALANQEPVYSTDPSEAELAQMLAGWRDEIRTPPLMSPVTPRDAVVALTRAVDSRKRTRSSMAIVGSVAAAVLCLGGFASVVAGSWSYIFNGHEEAGVQAIIAARPQSKLDPKVLRQQIETLKDYALTDAVKSLPVGTMAQSDWQQATKVLSEGGLLGQAVDAKDLFTNEMIDPKILAEVAASLK